MRIISGTARNIVLTVPKGVAVRPTSAMARKALFDSLGKYDANCFVDLFAGSGALGLEAASRGAGTVVFIERSHLHCRIIDENIEKVVKAGVDSCFQVIRGDATTPWRYVRNLSPDIVVADPPYADSDKIFNQLSASREFHHWLGTALLVWELPESTGVTDAFSDADHFWHKSWLKTLGGTRFLMAKNGEI